MNFQFAHYNYNVMDLYKSIKFYEEAERLGKGSL